MKIIKRRHFENVFGYKPFVRYYMMFVASVRRTFFYIFLKILKYFLEFDNEVFSISSRQNISIPFFYTVNFSQ